MDRIEFLRRIPLFSQLPDGALVDIGALCHEARLPRNSVLFTEGQPADSLYIVISGQIKVSKQSEGGQETILRVISEGELLAIIAALGEDSYPASAETMSEASVWRIFAPEFQDLIPRYPALALAVIQILKSHVKETQEMLRQLAAERVEQRIAHVLLRLQEKVGRDEGERIELSMPLSRADLAAMAATTIETTSRVLGRFESAGIVQAGRGRVTILNLERLSEIAGYPVSV